MKSIDGNSISVVIPTYNRARWLPSAVESVLTQTLAPKEIIIVDDGSTDETPEICQALQGPIHYIRQENGGAAAARNRGIREASGDWIAFQDSDDLWEPRRLELQAEALTHWPEAGWCISGFSVIDEDGRVTHPGPAFEQHFAVFADEHVSAEEFFGRYLQRDTMTVAGEEYPVFAGSAFVPLFLGNFAFLQGALVRRSLLERIGAFDLSYRFAEDTNLFHRLAVEAPLLIIMNPLFRYRVGSYDSIIKPGNTVPLIEYSLRSLDECLAHASSREDAAVIEHYRRGRERLLLRLAYSHLSNYDSRSARRALRLAWESGARSPRMALLFTMAHLPGKVLRFAHAAKRFRNTIRLKRRVWS